MLKEKKKEKKIEVSKKEGYWWWVGLGNLNESKEIWDLIKEIHGELALSQ